MHTDISELLADYCIKFIYKISAYAQYYNYYPRNYIIYDGYLIIYTNRRLFQKLKYYNKPVIHLGSFTIPYKLYNSADFTLIRGYYRLSPELHNIHIILNSQNNHPLIVYYRNIRHIYICNNIYVCGKINNNINHYKIKVNNISYKFYFANNIIYCIFITGNILIRKIVYYPGTNIHRIDTSYYKSGIKHGITQTYYPNGNPRMIAEYNNGQYIRDYLYYNRDGSLYKRIKK